METNAVGLQEAPPDGDAESRIAMFNENVGLARTIARSLYAARTSNDVDYYDYLHYAFAGLLEAMDRYRVDGGASFNTFASYRIRGSVLNGIAKFSEFREQAAFRRHLRQDRLQALSKEICSNSRDSLFEQMVELTLGLAIGFVLEDVGGLRHADTEGDLLQQKYLTAKTRAGLLKHVENLPDTERTVIQFHYFYQTSLTDIATALKLSKGRISQIHHSAIKRLKTFFDPNDKLDHYL